MKNKKITIIIVALLLIVIAVFALYMMVARNNNPKNCTTYGNSVAEQCIEDYIGLPQEEAVSKAKQYKYIPKVVSIDGEPQGVLDIAGPVIHLVVENGRVVGGYFEEERKAE